MEEIIRDEAFIRDEFSSWISDMCQNLEDENVKANPARKYYVYVLCEKTEQGDIIPFYIGKGTGERVWNHSDETEQEKKEIEEEAKNYNWTEEEKNKALDAVSEKHKKIQQLGEEKLVRVIIKSGLTEYESFMCESALINIFRLKDLAYPRSNELTNKVNGHANAFEKNAGMETEALDVKEYYKRYCKKPIILNEMTPEQGKDFEGKKILFQNINTFYSDCINKSVFPTEQEQNEAIREAVRAFWRQGNPDKMEYVFAMYQGKIKGVYKVLPTYDAQGRFYSILDVWQENYPRFDKLEQRKNDYGLAQAIYNDLVKKLGYEPDSKVKVKLPAKDKKELYSKLSVDARKCVESFPWKNNKNTEDFYNQELNKWLDRKYFVLADIEADKDPDFRKYINCSVKKRLDNGEYESIFAGKKCGTKRAKPANFVYFYKPRIYDIIEHKK